MRFWFLVTAAVLLPIATWGWVHAGDEIRFTGGFGSGLSPGARRFGALVLAAVAAAALVAALAW